MNRSDHAHRTLCRVILALAVLFLVLVHCGCAGRCPLRSLSPSGGLPAVNLTLYHHTW